MRLHALSLATLLLAISANAQHVTNPRAGITDAAARQTYLARATNPLLLEAIKQLPSCIAMPVIPAPVGRINIPWHYFNGSHGAINPAEGIAAAPYDAFQKRITAGMNQYVATGNHAEAACALAQLALWAKANALLDYDAKESSQAWYTVGWTLGSAGVTESVLVEDTTLNHAQQKQVIAWLDAAAHKLLNFERPGVQVNNLHYWRALAATSIGIIANDNSLFGSGIDTYKQAIGEINAHGALPLEMARHERATHYQAFALQPLITIAELAQRQGVDLYAYQSHGRTLRDAILFFGNAVDNPSLIEPYTHDKQVADYNSSDYAPFAFYVARFGPEGIPHSILAGVEQSTDAPRIGGSVTVLATK